MWRMENHGQQTQAKQCKKHEDLVTDCEALLKNKEAHVRRRGEFKEEEGKISVILLVLVQNLGMKMKRKEIMETMRLTKKRLVNILLTLSRTVTSNHGERCKKKEKNGKKRT